jgi:cell division protein FtsA
LAGDSDEGLSSPSFATAVGLLMEGLSKQEKFGPTATAQESNSVSTGVSSGEMFEEIAPASAKESTTTSKPKKSVFQHFSDRFREFLDNAE